MFFILIGFKYILNRFFVLTGLDTLNIDKNDLDPVSATVSLNPLRCPGCLDAVRDVVVTVDDLCVTAVNRL